MSGRARRSSLLGIPSDESDSMIRLSPDSRKHWPAAPLGTYTSLFSRRLNEPLEAEMMSRPALGLVLLAITFLAAHDGWSQPPSAGSSAAQPNEWQSLFDGKSLDGWKANENKGSFKVVDGAIAAGGGERSHLFYNGLVGNHEFKNFQLKLKVKTEPKANSGVYFHTSFQEEGWPSKGYEAQVNNSQEDPRKTGSLYGVVDVTRSPAQDHQWFDYQINVEGKHIMLLVNGEKVTDFTETDDMPHLKEFPHRKLSSGTIALQAHDPGSMVYYKDIQIRLLP